MPVSASAHVTYAVIWKSPRVYGRCIEPPGDNSDSAVSFCSFSERTVNVMRLKSIALIGIVTTLLAAPLAMAQQTDPIHFRTPFAFVVGETLLPAGAYTVSVVSPTGTLLFKSETGSVSALASSMSTESLDTSNRLKLVFHRYGTHYYISEIWTPGYKAGRTVTPHAAEVQLAKKETQQHVVLYADATRH
jgi:hypothetical protein